MKRMEGKAIAVCITGAGSRRAYYRKKLESYGYSVIIADNRMSDIEAGLSRHPNVIFIDENDRNSLVRSISTEYGHPAPAEIHHTPIIPLQIL
jgi:hypothetical protein